MRSEATGGWSRRHFIRGATLAAAAGALPWARPGAWAAEADLPVRRAPATPAEALRRLYQGNERFMRGEITAPNRNIARLKEIVDGQTPFAAFLGCADSRVPIELVFDQGFGDLFVTRIAGNVATAEEIASLEYGTAVAGAQVIYVLGHTKCGAVAATMEAGEVPGQISTLYRHIRPAVREAGGSVDEAIRLNVRNQARTLAETSPLIARLVREGKLLVAGGVYELATGKVHPVEVAA